MEWTDFLNGIIGILFSFLSAVASVILAPVDLLINAVVPQATTAVVAFFTWVISWLQYLMDFLDWFLYILGITPATWGLIMLVLSALLLAFIFLFPLKLVISTFKGMKG